MVIVAITDIHGDVDHLSRLGHHVTEANLVLVTGDLTMFGRRHAAWQVVNAVRELNPHILAVSGNCDYPEVDDYLSELNINLHATHRLINGIEFLGLSGSLPCPGRTPNERQEDEHRAFLAEAATGLKAGAPSILVSHQPPRNTTADCAQGGAHVGSRAVREFIESTQPLICFTGHIHEARGIDTLGRTKIVNPGPLRTGAYAYAVVTDTVELLEIRGR